MSLHKEVTFSVSPERVFEVLTNGDMFAAATGMTAQIEARNGAAFVSHNGYIEGRHIELVPGERIVQAWRGSEWAPGVYSLVRFTLTREGSGTRLQVDHDAYPEGASPFYPTWHEHLSENWPVFYFNHMEKFFAGQAG